jgi:hypothetical protein
MVQSAANESSYYKVWLMEVSETPEKKILVNQDH